MFKKFIYVILINLLLIPPVLAEVEELKDKSDEISFKVVRKVKDN